MCLPEIIIHVLSIPYMEDISPLIYSYQDYNK